MTSNFLFQKVLEALMQLPGVGKRTALRFLFYLIERNRPLMRELGQLLLELDQRLIPCSQCHYIDTQSPCTICSDPNRQPVLCVVPHSRDVLRLEEAGIFKGKYHVLGGLINPVEDVHPDQLHIDDIPQRITQEGFQEVILALPSTPEGEITMHYIARRLQNMPVRIYTLARGISYGADLEFVDAATLARALELRIPYDRIQRDSS